MTRISLALLPLLLLTACGGLSSEEPKLASEPTVHIAEAALDNGNVTLSLQISHVILTKHPNNLDAMIVHANAYFMEGAAMEAKLWYERALKREPNSVHALTGMGRVYLVSDPGKAEAYFNKALGQDPRSVAALNDEGIACDLQGRHADAQSFYRRALSLAPDNNDTLVNLGLSLVKGGDRAGALEILQPIANSPDMDLKLRHNLANALSAAGDPEGAQRVMSVDQSISVTP